MQVVGAAVALRTGSPLRGPAPHPTPLVGLWPSLTDLPTFVKTPAFDREGFRVYNIVIVPPASQPDRPLRSHLLQPKFGIS
jgi:hypothetical protein